MNIKNIAFWVMIFLIIGLAIYLIFFIKSESYKCMNNPLVYGVNQFKTNQGEFTCICSAPNTERILVTKNNISLLNSGNLFT